MRVRFVAGIYEKIVPDWRNFTPKPGGHVYFVLRRALVRTTAPDPDGGIVANIIFIDRWNPKEAELNRIGFYQQPEEVWRK